MTRRRWRAVGAMGFALALMGGVVSCDLGTITVPNTEPQLVVHSVLNPTAPEQVVFLEHTLTGTITIPDTGFNPSDPIFTAGGIPVSGATVEILDPAGKSFVGVEDTPEGAGNGVGSGVYRVPLAGPDLVPGKRYELRIHTPAGDEITGSTQIPRPGPLTDDVITRTLNRDHDTLTVSWAPSDGARSYAVRIESPFGPFFLFTDSTHIRVTGDLRNPFAGNLERVLIPGFHQEMVVAAVDSNFYNYYRTGNDPFTGSGIISSVTGGLGMFGAVVTLNAGTLVVTADQTAPIEGRYRLVSEPGTNAFASQIVLYVESKAARAGLPDALSGRYATPNPNSRTDGIVGQQTGTTISLALLGHQLAGDTLELFEGILSGDTLSGRYSINAGSVTFVRSPQRH